MQFAMHGLFNTIAMEHYEKFITALKEYNELTNNNQQWDLLEHSSEENKQYFSLFNEKQKSGIISIVFIVMSIEGLINDYGVSHLEIQRFNQLEKESVPDKIVNIYAEVTGQPFPKDKQVYQNINDLISIRNTLVHSKSAEVDFELLMRNDAEAEKEYISYINSVVGNKRKKGTKQKFIDEVLRNSGHVYVELKNLFQN